MKRKTTTFYFTIFILAACNSSRKMSTDSYNQKLSGASFFSGYKVLSVPKDNINIGSKWIKGQGPLNSGLMIADLSSTQSLSNYELQRDNNFNVKIKLEILDYLGLTADYSAVKNYDMNINQAEVVRVNDFSKMNYTSGQTYIFEGIKVNSIRLTLSKGKIDTLSLKLKKINKVLDIDPNQTLNNSQKLSISGLNLFVAYRLVTFGNMQIEDLKDWFQEPKSSKVDIHPDGSYRIISREQLAKIYLGGYPSAKYDGKIYNISEYKNTFSSPEIFEQDILDNQKWINGYNSSCKLVLLFTCYNEIINNAPKKIAINLHCQSNGESDKEDIYAIISSSIQDNYFVLDEFSIKNLTYENNNENSFPLLDNGIKPYISHRKLKVEIKNVADNTTPGW